MNGTEFSRIAEELGLQGLRQIPLVFSTHCWRTLRYMLHSHNNVQEYTNTGKYSKA